MQLFFDFIYSYGPQPKREGNQCTLRAFERSLIGFMLYFCNLNTCVTGVLERAYGIKNKRKCRGYVKFFFEQLIHKHLLTSNIPMLSSTGCMSKCESIQLICDEMFLSVNCTLK